MKEEIFSSTLQEIKTIFQFLMEEEPSPDDEIEAREKLIGLFTTLRQNNTHVEIANFIVKVLEDLENWDTLELWFKEVDSLIAGIKKVLEFFTLDKEIESQPEDIDASEVPSEFKKSARDTSDELIEIVAQVSEQFKGQIESLKEKIEALQEELDKKTEIIEEFNESDNLGMQENAIPDYENEIFENEALEPIKDANIMSKKSKLEPPKIHIPKLKVPSPVTKQEELEDSLNLSDMEDTLKELSSMGDTLQEISDISDVSKKSKIAHEVVEEEVKLTEIPQMSPSERKEIPKSSLKNPRFDDDLVLSEIPKITPEQQPEIKEHKKNKRIIPKVIEDSPKKAILTEIPKMVTNQVEKKQELKSEVQTSDEEPDEFIAIASQKGTNSTKDSKKKIIVPNVIEETTNPKTSSLEGSLFIPGTPKTEVKGIKLPNSPKIGSKSEGDAIFTLKKPSVKLEEIKTESIKTTRSDLFNVFSSIPDQDAEDNEIKREEHLGLDKTEQIEEKSKKNKKKDKKKEKSKKAEKITEQNEDKLETLTTTNEESSTVDYDNLPNDKDILYQDLIALEGKRYSIERNFKELEIRLTNRNINENEFRKQSNSLSKKLKEISSNITKLRNAIAKL